MSVCNGFHQSSDVAKNLFNDLFINKSYNKQVRPINDQNDAILVTVNFRLFSIHNFDEVAEKIAVSGYLDVIWWDDHLVWNRSAYNDIYDMIVLQFHLHLTLDKTKPDIVLKNGFNKFEELGGSFYYVIADYNGLVAWYPYHMFESQCAMDVTFDPFDEQTCHVIFSIWTYRYYEVGFYPDSKLGLGGYVENSLWTITSTSVQINRVLGSDEIDFTINLRRKPMYYIVNIIISLIFLGILNSLVFIIPADAGEKMSYSVTVFLSFAVFLTIIKAQLPVNSESTSILSIYIVVQLSYCILVLVVNSFLLRMHHRNECNEKSKIFVIAVKLQRRMCFWRSKTQSDTYEKKHTNVTDGCAIENASPKMNDSEDAM
ncbi:neuronal acetylcholine receptor subunit alpha-6-like [Mytilus trossulus]|uniref:neuronal acetylcholine receptor subunit alpha-6-like n=1 Tax=Mytilus trossulus TaxID=6551 RepID=UPI0030073C3A